MTNKVIQGGDPFNFSASGALGATDSGVVVGLLCSTSSSGTLTLVDGKGRVLCNAMPLTAGQFYPMPFNFIGGLTATVGGTANCTLSVA